MKKPAFPKSLTIATELAAVSLLMTGAGVLAMGTATAAPSATQSTSMAAQVSPSADAAGQLFEGRCRSPKCYNY